MLPERQERKGISSIALKMGATVNISFSSPHSISKKKIKKNSHNIYDDRGLSGSNLVDVRRTSREEADVADILDSQQKLIRKGHIRKRAGERMTSSELELDTASRIVVSSLKSYQESLYTRQSLTIYNISRQFLMTRIQCTAENSKTLSPVTTSATLDMNCKYNLPLLNK